jgi:hypothetical protein
MNEDPLTDEQKLAIKKLELSARDTGIKMGLQTGVLLIVTGLAVAAVFLVFDLPEDFLKLGGFCSGAFVAYYMYLRVIEDDKRIADELARIMLKDGSNK